MEQEQLSKFQKFEQAYFSRGKVWMYSGLSIIIFGLVLMTVRDINEIKLTNLLVLGTVSTHPLSGVLSSTVDSARSVITTETLIQHSTEQILLLAMSLFKLAIGGFIFLIIQQLVATRKYAMAKAKTAGIPIGPEPKTPMFAKLFPILLVLGTDIQFINVGVLMSIWDLNALNILNMQFAGTTSGAAFQSAVFLEKLIGSLVVPVEMAGATLMLSAIPLGLATIVVNLRIQGKMFPMLISDIMVRKTGRTTIRPIMALGSHGTPAPSTMAKSATAEIAPKGVVMFTIAGLLLGLSGLIIFAPLRALNQVTLVSQAFSQTMTSAAIANLKLWDGIIAVTVEQALFVGLGIVVFAINIFLLQIIKSLRSQRNFFGETLEKTVGSRITPVEKPLWMTRGALAFAIVGFSLMILNFIFALVIDNANIAGDSVTAGTFMIISRNIKLSAFGFLLTGVGLSMVNIMVNLQLTARTLPGFFSRMSQFARSGRSDSERIDLPTPMSLAPWKLFYFILTGAIITIIVTFPLAFIEVQAFLTWKGAAVGSAAYSSGLLLDRLLEHSLLPLKLFGLGIALMGIGRTFGVILGFVKARRQLISEGIDSLLALTA